MPASDEVNGPRFSELDNFPLLSWMTLAMTDVTVASLCPALKDIIIVIIIHLVGQYMLRKQLARSENISANTSV